MMDKRAFPPRLRVLASVPRWSVIPLIKQDYVSSHSFFVAFYAHQIATLIHWNGPMDELLWRAIIHDADEAFTGDVIGYAKRKITTKELINRYVETNIEHYMPSVVGNETPAETERDIEAIIKAADLLDALFFMCGEHNLGNQIIAARITHNGLRDVMDAWHRLPADEKTLNETFKTVVEPAIMAHMNPESYSV